MSNEIEASFTLCDHLNPGFGYQLRISRRRHGGNEKLLFTSRAPDTGDDLLTAADCMRVIAMYIPGVQFTEPPKHCVDSHCELPMPG
jgi:hypothetical protein